MQSQQNATSSITKHLRGSVELKEYVIHGTTGQHSVNTGPTRTISLNTASVVWRLQATDASDEVQSMERWEESALGTDDSVTLLLGG